jgi:hypothetical protein
MEVLVNSAEKLKRVLLLVAGAALCAAASEAAVRIQGKIAASDGTPLPGDVTVVSGVGGLKTMNYRTDSQGTFAFDVDAADVWLMVAKADGYVSEEREVLLSGEQRRINLDFTLGPAGIVSGHVVDEAGNSVPAAALRVRYPGTQRKFEFVHESLATADSLGNFRLTSVAQNRRFVIEASTPDRPFTTSVPMSFAGAPLQNVVLSLSRKGQVVRGRVTDAAGSPLAGVPVRIRAFADIADFSPEDRQSPDFSRIGNRQTFSAPDGSYNFQGVPAGRVVLVAGRPGPSATKREDTVRADQELTINLAVH